MHTGIPGYSFLQNIPDFHVYTKDTGNEAGSFFSQCLSSQYSDILTLSIVPSPLIIFRDYENNLRHISQGILFRITMIPAITRAMDKIAPLSPERVGWGTGVVGGAVVTGCSVGARS